MATSLSLIQLGFYRRGSDFWGIVDKRVETEVASRIALLNLTDMPSQAASHSKIQLREVPPPSISGKVKLKYSQQGISPSRQIDFRRFHPYPTA